MHPRELHPSLPRTPEFPAANLATPDSAEKIAKTEGGH